MLLHFKKSSLLLSPLNAYPCVSYLVFFEFYLLSKEVKAIEMKA